MNDLLELFSPGSTRRRRAAERSAGVGDLLAIPATGAYCFTMSDYDNGNRRIPVVFTAAVSPTWWCAGRPGKT